MRRIRQRLQEKKGMTMAEVLVAFVLFVLILLMFQRTVVLASNVLRSSEDVRRRAENLYADFYRETAYQRDDGTAGDGDAYRFSGEGGDGFEIRSRSGSYENGGGDGTVYYFGLRKEVGGG